MKIIDLIQGLSKSTVSHLTPDILEMPVLGVTSDSREIKPGFVFVAIKGGAQDGHAFLAQAQQQGAVLLVGEAEHQTGLLAPYLQVLDARVVLAKLAANFYRNPSHRMLVVGITGTSGKTTTSYLVESMLKAAGHKVGLIGTVECRYGKTKVESTHTTPGAVSLQKLLREMADAACTAVVMEVSSHALRQHRTSFVAFDAMVFSNLSPEHLDFHRDMEDYFRTKAMLFREYIDDAIGIGKHPVAIINGDDSYGQRILMELRPRLVAESTLAPMLRVLSYGLQNGSDISIDELKISLSSIQGKVGKVAIKSPLVGRFNALNILAAVAVGQGIRLDPRVIGEGVSEMSAVPGRLEAVENNHRIHVLVDYAHKPDALSKVLDELRQERRGARLLTVFGCGGDRDRSKRPVMGRIAATLSDEVWVTSDNPRSENPEAIIQEILGGITPPSKKVHVEPDRRKAIIAAIAAAHAGDIVLIAGKGHETYQLIGDQKLSFDDRLVAKEALSLRSRSRAR